MGAADRRRRQIRHGDAQLHSMPTEQRRPASRVERSLVNLIITTVSDALLQIRIDQHSLSSASLDFTLTVAVIATATRRLESP